MKKINIKKIISVTVLCLYLSICYGVAHASETFGTIIVSSPNDGYAWSDRIGWVNFGAVNGNIKITDNGVIGYAWNANYGWINMSPKNGGISVSKEGELSGRVWNDTLGWINLMGISIDSSGRIIGRMTGEKAGALIFDCKNCRVFTDYRPAIFRQSPYTGGGLESRTIIASEVPAQLFDIRLLTNKNEVNRIQDLTAHVTFESFGSESTPVEMTFSIIDSNGTEIWKATNETVIQTEAVYNRSFSDVPGISDGKYVLRLETLYNESVKDEFESPFSIVNRQKVSNIEEIVTGDLSKWILTIGGLVIFIGILIALTIGRRKKQKYDQ